MSENSDGIVGNGNLTPFKPGESGNPAGRPKGAKDGILATMRRLGQRRAMPEVIRILKARGIELEDGNNNEAVSWSTLLNALGGDNQAAGLWMKADEETRKIDLAADFKINIESKDADML